MPKLTSCGTRHYFQMESVDPYDTLLLDYAASVDTRIIRTSCTLECLIHLWQLCMISDQSIVLEVQHAYLVELSKAHLW